MGFEVFNLKQSIREYNRSPEGEKKPISTDETFQVFSFSENFLEKTLKGGFEAYKNSKFTHTGVTAVSKEIAETLKASFEEYIEKSKLASSPEDKAKVPGLVQEVKATLRQNHENQKAGVNFQSRQNTVERLLSSALWEEFAAIAQSNEVKKRQLEDIQATLQQHGRFCTHAHTSLLLAYDVLQNLAPLFEQSRKDLQTAKKRRFFNRIPPSILHAWETHLNQQEEIFRKECDDIVVHMQSRLSVAAKDPLLRDADVLSRFVDLLKAKGFVKESYVAPQIRGDELTDEQFVRFHSIVEKHGSDTTRKNLFELPWFGGLGSEKKSVRENLAERFEVSSFIPTRRRSPQFLFYAANLRFDWFENYVALARIDAALKKVEEQKTIFVTFHERLPNLALAEKEFESEEERIEKAIADCKKGIRRIFTGKTVQFLEIFRQKLREKRLTLVREKIEILTGIMEEVEDQENANDKANAFNPSSFLNEIKVNLESLEGFFKKIRNLKESVSKKIEDLKHIFHEQKRLVEKRISISAARQAQQYEIAEKERHEEALLAPFYSDKGATPQEITWAFDYLEIAVNSLKPDKYAAYINEIKEIYASMKEAFKKNLGNDYDVAKLAQCALFLNSYRELATRKFLVSDAKRKTAQEFCTKGDRARSPNDAIQYFTQAIHADPNYLSAWRKMGGALWSLHKDVTSSDDELKREESKEHLAQSVSYLYEAGECFVKPLSLEARFLHPLVRETLAERTAEYFCQWIGVSEKRRINVAELEILHQTSTHTENVLMAIGGAELAERVDRMKTLREANNFNALEELAKENLLFVIQTMPFTLQDPIEKDFLTLEQKLLKFLKKHVSDFIYDETQVDVLEDILKEIIAHRAFEYKDLEKLEKNQDYLELKPEVHFVLSVIAKLRYEAGQIAGVLDPIDKKSRVKELNKFFAIQQKRFFDVKIFPRAAKKKLTNVLTKHGSFGVSLDKIKRVKTAVKSVRKSR